MEKYCEKCKKTIEDEESKFCPDCGTLLIEVLETENKELENDKVEEIPETEENERIKLNYCEHCKKCIEDREAKFCPDCGTLLTEMPKSEKENGKDVEIPRTEESEKIKLKYCEQCKKYIENKEMKFCPDCGTVLVDREYSENQEKNDGESKDKLTFRKIKMLGYFTYRATTTEVEIKSFELRIKQTTNRFMLFKREHEKQIAFSDIQAIDLCTKMDFWDTLYAAVFVILGFTRPAIFLLAAIFAYTAYGKVIEIKLKDGNKFLIPFKGAEDEWKILLSSIKK